MNELNRFKFELMVRKYAPTTIQTYCSQAEFLIAHFGLKPDIDQVKEYLLTLKSQAHHKQVVATVRHWYSFIHGIKLDLSELPYPRRESKLQIVLSENEMQRLIDVPKNLKHQLVIYLLYGCGLRVGEVLRLKPHNIDRGQMCIHIKAAKGKKDRTVGMSTTMLDLIDRYLYEYRPENYLLEGQFKDQYTSSSINTFLKRYAKRAHISKEIWAHLLRTTFAVHCINQKKDMGLLQRAMGHANIKTTHHYTKMSSGHLNVTML